jgi:bis(5'-nucleosyl)-tetraphosphatase (symmetrical)
VSKKTIIIGDIHGCLHEFKDLIQKIGPSRNDRVVCLGDFMDKGPFPVDCVRYARLQGFEAVISNHEDRHLRWRKREARRIATGIANQMRPMIPKDLAANEQLSDEDIAWLSGHPPFQRLHEPNWIAVHGGLLSTLTLAEQKPDQMMRLRWVDEKDGSSVPSIYDDKKRESSEPPEGSVHWTELWHGPESVVYGHEAFSLSNPKVTRKFDGVECWGIDTGVVHGGHLTALILPSFEVVQVKAREVYDAPHAPIPLQ